MIVIVKENLLSQSRKARKEGKRDCFPEAFL
jgi:hypothetical protein